MPVRKANAEWRGNLQEGEGTMAFGSGAFEGPFSFNSRMENGNGTNPEELLGAAHAGCFSMAFSLELTKAGHTPTRVRTNAAVAFEPEGDGFAIKSVALETEGDVPGISEDEFQKIAEAAKEGCPVSQALAGTTITLDARLISS